MAQISPKKVKLKNNKEVVLRSVDVSDAPAVKLYNEAIYGESDFLFPMTAIEKTIEEWEKIISSIKSSPYDLIAVVQGEEGLLGMALLRSSPFSIFSKNGEIANSVRKAYRGLGIGKELMRNLMIFASEKTPYHRLQLSVVSENIPAINLYKACGFFIEGQRKENIFHEGRFWDECLMGYMLKK